ncbi:MAG: hypothetical protein GY830_04395 [Bacteroidetes bacterium]|nr:hypothetical protein [Bacteroidota bacterium]
MDKVKFNNLTKSLFKCIYKVPMFLKKKRIFKWNQYILIFFSFLFSHCSKLSEDNGINSMKENKKLFKQRLLNYNIDFKRRKLLNLNSEYFFEEISSNSSILNSNNIILNNNSNYITLGETDFGFCIFELNNGNLTMYNGFHHKFNKKILPKSIIANNDGGYSIFGDNGETKENIFQIDIDSSGKIVNNWNIGTIFPDFPGNSLLLQNNQILLVSSIKDLSDYNLGLILIPNDKDYYELNLWSGSGSIFPKITLNNNDNNNVIVHGVNKLNDDYNFFTKIDYNNKKINWYKIYEFQNKDITSINSGKIFGGENSVWVGFNQNIDKEGIILTMDNNGDKLWSSEIGGDQDDIFYDSLTINDLHLILGASKSFSQKNALILLTLNANGQLIDGYNKALAHLDIESDSISFIENEGDIMVTFSSEGNTYNIKINTNFSTLPLPFFDISPNFKEITSSILIKNKYLEKDIFNKFYKSKGYIENYHFNLKSRFIFENYSNIFPSTTENISIGVKNNSAGHKNTQNPGSTTNLFDSIGGEVLLGIILGGSIFLLFTLICWFILRKKRKGHSSLNSISDHLNFSENKKFEEFKNRIQKNQTNIDEEYSVSERKPLNTNDDAASDESNTSTANSNNSSAANTNNSSNTDKTSNGTTTTTESSSLLKKKNIRKKTISDHNFLSVSTTQIPINIIQNQNENKDNDSKTSESDSISKNFIDVNTVMNINMPINSNMNSSSKDNSQKNKNTDTQSTEESSSTSKESESLLKDNKNLKSIFENNS